MQKLHPPSDALPTDRLPGERELGAEAAAFSLLVVRDGATSLHPLPASGSVVVGRAKTASIRIDHRSVSREHAVLRLGERLLLEDLGSANGTRVRDVPLAPGTSVEVFPDDVIDLGAVLLVVQYRKLEQRLRRACHAEFLALRLEEECERGTENVALIRLEISSALSAHAAQVLLASELRSRDLVAQRALGHYDLLLFDRTPDEAEIWLERVATRLVERGAQVQRQLRCLPRDGRNAARLLGRAAEARVEPLRRSALPVAHDPAMLRVCRVLERVAPTQLSVILLGETGVGKELCAELVHAASRRAAAPLVRLNCAALSDNLLESELFGHERGAFTGAIQDKPGLLESASGGTLFLDEVGDMPLAMQVKLLRVFEAREVRRLGSRKPHPIDLRVIAATHHDLLERVSQGQFREDLLYRLDGISVLVPPLRERPEDILPLALHFLAAGAPAPKRVPTLSAEARSWLSSYEFPGNVRELRNLMDRAAALCDDGIILPAHLEYERSRRAAVSVPPESPGSSPRGLKDDVRALERARIESALAEAGGSQRRTASLLGISRGALLRRLEQLGLGGPRKN